MRAPLRGGSQLARFYPRRHLRAGSACAILGASSPSGNILFPLLLLPKIKQLKREEDKNILCLLYV